MPLVLKDRVRETSTTTGTGTLTLAGAVVGFQTFSSAIGNTNTTYYAISNNGTSEWEVGIGTVSAGALSRDTVLASSNSGSLVNFSAGAKDVFCTYPADKSVELDASGVLTGVPITVLDTNFTLQDNVDPTKQAKFDLTNIATGTTRTFTFINADGVIPTTASSNTWTGTNTFTGSTVSVGQAVGTSTYSFGTGATQSGLTKTITLGGSGASGSTTNIAIGSAVGGSTTNVNAYGTWTYTNTISASISGNAATVTNGLYTTDLGVTVQAYDADTTKNDVANTFTANQTINGNLNFSGDARRITGDFSTSTFNNRTYFQSNVINGNTFVFSAPNGTSTNAGFFGANASDVTNASLVQISASSTDCRLRSSALGTGTVLPLTFSVPDEKMRIDSSGNVGIGTSAPTTKLTISANTVLPSAGAITGAGVTTTFWSVSPDSSSNVFLLDSIANPCVYMGRRAQGTAASPTALVSGNTIFQLAGRGYGATAYSSGTRALLSYVTSENWTDSAQGTYMAFYTTTSGTTTLTEGMRLDASSNLQFNSGYGSVATAYGCRAWVNFNGTGTVAIRASGNVSSITDNGTGNYTVNFTTAMPDANYAVVASAKQSNSNSIETLNSLAPFTYTTTSVSLRAVNANSNAVDTENSNIAIFR